MTLTLLLIIGIRRNCSLISLDLFLLIIGIRRNCLLISLDLFLHHQVQFLKDASRASSPLLITIVAIVQASNLLFTNLFGSSWQKREREEKIKINRKAFYEKLAKERKRGKNKNK